MQINKIKFTLKKIGFFVAILNILFLAKFCFALENKYPDILGNSLPANPSLENYVSYFANIGISISGILAALVIVFGGVQYIISGAIGKSNSEAKEWIKSGILGLFLLISAYIILATINPALVNPTMGKLLNVIPFVNIPISNLNKGTPITYYKEIPIGTLTEKVLSNTNYCYDFDDFGDPIQKQIKADNGSFYDGPGFINHDRTDCIIKLNKAIENKSKVIKELAEKINWLMSNCSCAQGQSSQSSSQDQSQSESQNQIKNSDKNNPLVKCEAFGECAQPSSNTTKEDCESGKANCGKPLDCNCSGNCEPNPNEFSLCPQGTKNIVEKGPIEIGVLDFASFTETMLGNMSNVSENYMGYINSLYTCIWLDKSNSNIKVKNYKGLEEFNDDNLSIQQIINLVETQTIQINEKNIILINSQNYSNLKLIQQLQYLKEKLSQLTKTLNDDKENLNKAKTELNKCYMAKTYVEYLKKVEETDKENTVLMVTKNFNAYENNFTDISKYCSGFGYENSECFYQCENACPLQSQQAIDLYQQCNGNCDKVCNDNSIGCITQKNICKENQGKCLLKNNLLDKRPCTNSAGGNFNNFSECLQNCQNNCSDYCDDKFKNCTDVVDACKKCNSKIDPKQSYAYSCDLLSEKYCSDELKICKASCSNDSQCILENKEACVYNFKDLAECSMQNTDYENKKNCIEVSYKCKYASSEQSGYADCLKNPFSLSNNFSSSEIFKNPFWQKCINPLSTSTNIECISPTDPKSICKDVCPEVQKCPTSSDCPTCPCEIIKEPTDNTNFDPKGKAFFSVYGHMKINVSVGQIVKQGDVLGEISNIGTNMGDHLHFAVGFENGNSGLDVATSFDISTKISTSGISGIPGSYATPLPRYVNQSYKNYVLKHLDSPLDINYCNWKQLAGSSLHNNTAAFAQDWVCDNGSQKGAPVKMMVGGDNIKSTVYGIIPSSGGVIVKHEVDKDILKSLIDVVIKDYQIANAICQEYKYNDDPLTFYCEQDWWKDPELSNTEPLANNYICPKANEIPVGQAVDNSENWAKKFLQSQNDFILKTQELITRLKEIDALRKSGNYCKCGSDCGNVNEKTCKDQCTPIWEVLTDENGAVVSEKCVCAKQGCQGNPCQYMMSLLMGSTGLACPKGKTLESLGQIYENLKLKNEKLSELSLINRSDLLKELIYSRQEMNNCSSESKANTVADQTKLTSCRRVRNNFISPIKGEKTIINGKKIDYPCYGVDLGENFSQTITYESDSSSSSSSSTVKQNDVIIPETDNWFCCVPRD